MTNLHESPVPLYSEEMDRRWRSSLMAFFLRRVHDRCEAEDLTQETFARSVQRLSAADNTNIGSYLFTIGANLLRDRARRAVSHRVAAHDSLSDVSANSDLLCTEDQGAERVIIAKEALQRALAALGELDARTRDIFILFRLEKIKQREIAVRYGISVSAVEKKIIKAAAHLAARLDQND